MPRSFDLFEAPSEEDAARYFSWERRKWYQFMPRKFRRQIKRQIIETQLSGKAQRAKPDFFIIGAMKCGTSSLFTYLAQHSDIAPPTQKEIHFYNRDFDLGPRFYESHFPLLADLKLASTSAGRQLTFEATPDYIYHPLAAERIKKNHPHAKLILLLRDPVHRTFSHHKQLRRFKAEPLGFEHALHLEHRRLEGEVDQIVRGDPFYYSFRHHLCGYLARSRYAEQLERFFALFPTEQILVLGSEEFFSDTATVFRRIEAFLGLDHATNIQFEQVFPGAPGDLDSDLGEKLATYFRPHNERLFSMIDSRFDWR